MSVGFVKRLKCFILGHDWRYVESESVEKMQPYASTYKCSRCEKVENI